MEAIAAVAAAVAAIQISPTGAAMTETHADVGLEQVVAGRGLTASDTLARARLISEETGERLDAVLTRLGMVSEQALAEAIAQWTSLPMASAVDYPAEPILTDVSPRFLRDARAAPLRDSDEGLHVAFVDPFDTYPVLALSFATGRTILPVVGRASDVEAALDRLYPQAAQPAEAGQEEADETDLERLRDLASDAPVVRAVNALITRAAEARASDIHIEPTEDSLKIRLRVDGALHDEEPLPGQIKSAMVSRIKVMAGLNIAERRLPQDGRLRLAVRGHEIDLRVATSPTIHGESVVLRLLDRSNLPLDFEALGFDPATLSRYERVLRQPHGVVLVTGPTGSGKTTTLYASLNALNTSDRKVLTIEDPIEYRLAGINQTQVIPSIGLTFAAALRSFLRQDPDVMMVGEIRDLETAEVAVQAALTGHTILSTLHTNSAASAITRLIDMGVEPFLISSTLNGVLAQRLVRRLCGECRVPYAPSSAELETLGLADEQAGAAFFHARGCASCGGSGFKGRLALLELLVVDNEIGRMITARADARDIETVARASSMRTILEDGLGKARTGLTTIEEVLRVTKEA